MVIHHTVSRILLRIDKYFTLKPSSIGETVIYLGANFIKMTLPNGVWCWSTILSKYVQEVVKNYEIHIREHYDGKYALLKE